MGLKLERKKKKHFLLSLLYNFSKLLFFSPKTRLKLFCDLEWIFNRLALEESYKYYLTDKNPIRHYSSDFILRKLQKNDTILDLGCNQGDLSFLIGEEGYNVVGIDFNQEALRIANIKNKLPNIKYVLMDAHDFLSTNNEKFSVLILSHILEHLDNSSSFLKKIVPYFEKVYIEIPDFESNYSNIFRSDVNSSLVYTDTDHVFEFDRKEMIQIILNSGLTIIESEYRFGLQKYWCNVNKLH